MQNKFTIIRVVFMVVRYGIKNYTKKICGNKNKLYANFSPNKKNIEKIYINGQFLYYTHCSKQLCVF